MRGKRGLKRYILAVTLAVCVALSLSVGQGVARASATITWTIQGPYACVGPCAIATFFYGWGTAQGNPAMTYTFTGQVLDYNPVTNCLDQTETWRFMTQQPPPGRGMPARSPDTITFQTTSDTFCFTDDPNVSIETATYVITGGSGRFSGATGTATSEQTVLTNPQTGSGTFTVNIT